MSAPAHLKVAPRLVEHEPEDWAVCGIDPGLNTGFAVYRQKGLPVVGGAPIASGQIAGRFDFYDVFDSIVGWGHPLIIVMEKFTITPATAKKSPQPDPLYIIGAIERQAHKLGFPVELQTPARAKSFAPDTKLKAVGWHRPGNDHANDAARHVLTYVISHRQSHGGGELLDRIVDKLDIA